MKELIIKGYVVRIFGNLIKIYAPKSQADLIYNYLVEENLLDFAPEY